MPGPLRHTARSKANKPAAHPSMLENAVLTFRPVSQLQALLLLTPDSLSRRAHGRSDSPAHTPFYRNHRRTSTTPKGHASTLKRGMGSRDGKTNGKTKKQNLNITLPDKCHVVPRSNLSGVNDCLTRKFLACLRTK